MSPYDPEKVKHLLKLEYPDAPDLRCFAVSAKRYVLYRWRPGKRIQIVKASESALGAIIGRSRNETTGKLARRMWLSILMKHFKVSPRQRRRAKPLIDFDVPLRRKFPISQPSILKRLEPYNKTRSYDFRVKPFGFVQSATPATRIKLAKPPVSSGRAREIQVISGFGVNRGSGWSALGPSGIQYNATRTRTDSKCNDTLYMVDGVDNTVVAISNASNLLEKDEIVVEPGGKKFKCKYASKTCATLVYSGSPLNAPVAQALLPNGNLIVANTKGGNTLVELTPTGKVLATKTIDTNKSADIFGLLAEGTDDSTTVLFYTDTSTNTLQELEQ